MRAPVHSPAGALLSGELAPLPSGAAWPTVHAPVGTAVEAAMHPKVLYEERVTSPRTEALFLMLTIIPLAATAARSPMPWMDGWSFFLLAAAAMFFFYSINYRT